VQFWRLRSRKKRIFGIKGLFIWLLTAKMVRFVKVKKANVRGTFGWYEFSNIGGWGFGEGSHRSAEDTEGRRILTQTREGTKA
jgi:hypothetical protein